VTPATNPVELDAAGRADIWLSGDYKITVTDSDDVVIRTVDHIEVVDQGGDMTKAVYDPANISQQLVGTTAVQTITNKTIDGDSNTITNIDLSGITASLGADVNLTNTSNYFDGPSITQGTTGTWLVSGTVTVLNPGGNLQLYAKLWDGTTVIASAATTEIGGAQNGVSISLSGMIASPAGNLRISVRDLTSTSGVMKYNVTGNSKDSTIDQGNPSFMEVGVIQDYGQMPFAESTLKQFNEELRSAHLEAVRDGAYGVAR